MLELMQPQPSVFWAIHSSTHRNFLPLANGTQDMQRNQSGW